MSILGSNSGGSMNGPIFHEFKKQASLFLREKIKTAKLALMDVTSAQLLVEEVTSGNSEVPDARILKIISRAAFEVDDYWRIVDILHKRLLRFDRRNWRVSYNSLIVLEHLLTQGPERVSEEFQCDRDVIAHMETFQHVDEKGFNWGLNVRKKSQRILKLLEKGPLLKEERDKARKISRGIQGFGSFNVKTSNEQEEDDPFKGFGRCNSEFIDHNKQEDLFSDQYKNATRAAEAHRDNVDSEENICDKELKPLLGEIEKKNESKLYKSAASYHPFVDSDHDVANMSLLTADELQAY